MTESRKNVMQKLQGFFNIPSMCIRWLKLGDIIQNYMGRSVNYFRNPVRTRKLWNRKTTSKQMVLLK